jgi:hypothetical protein
MFLDDREFSIHRYPEAARLYELLTDVYGESAQVKRILNTVGIPNGVVNWNNTPLSIWMDVLVHAARGGRLRDLVRSAADDKLHAAYRGDFLALLESGTREPGRAAPAADVGQVLMAAGRSRSPILIALETAAEPLGDAEFSRTDRHLTVTLADSALDQITDLARKAHESAGTIAEIADAGHQIWSRLVEAQPRLAGLVKRIAATGPAQPVAWCGRVEVLERLRPALLVAHIGGGTADGFVFVRAGAHYLMPTQPEQARTMRPRLTRTRVTVAVADLSGTDRERLLHEVSAEDAAIVVDRDGATDGLAELAGLIHRNPVSPTRVLIAFGQPPEDATVVAGLLRGLPVVSMGASELATPELRRTLHTALEEYASTRALPCIIAAVRAAAVHRATAASDVAGCLRALSWCTWSWVGLPLFARHFGDVEKAAYPHLMDLRTVVDGTAYFNRREGIPEAYQADALTRAGLPHADRFHLYLSGGGGTGKSCFLRHVHDQVRGRQNTVAVWYRVDAPSSLWENVDSRVRDETIEAVREKYGTPSAESISEIGGSLGVFLSAAAEQLRQDNRAFEEINVFIDQLERTFESGEHADAARLSQISREFVAMLKDVRVGNGVRVFVASRKQYLPDFLGSSRKAVQCGLEFNVLQTIDDPTERISFVRKVLAWCRAQKLIHERLDIPGPVAGRLVEKVDGHPLKLMLALIQVLSADLDREIGEQDLDRMRPWEKLFAIDLQTAARDDLDWHLLLAMAHARTEIVRFEEVWWRLRMVDPRLTRRTDELRRNGVLERLWLFGYLGRTIHARPGAGEPARYVEFFHANLRDYLLQEVMARGVADLDIRGRRGGTPPAWRALDRLSVCAHDWKTSQQLLPPDDVRVLMEHRSEVVAGFPADGGEPLPFLLLFLRDAVEVRADLSAAAQECFILSALVHEEFGRWAFETLVHDFAVRVELCSAWLERCSPHNRPAVLRYLVELQVPEARGHLAARVLDGEPATRDELARALAGVLREPLYAVRYRNDVVSAVLDVALDRVRGVVHGLPDHLKSFVVQACGGDRNTLVAVLAYCAQLLDNLDEPMLFGPAGGTRSGDAPSAADDWLALAASAGYRGAEVVQPEPVTTEPVLGLAAGHRLRAAVGDDRVAAWSRELRERIGVPIPDLRLVTGETGDDEMELRLPRLRIHTNVFHPDRVRVSRRNWLAAGQAMPADGLGYDEAADEDVLWLTPGTVESLGLRIPVRTFDEAVVDWLETHCRRAFDVIFDSDQLVELIRDVLPTGRARSRLRGLTSPQFRLLRQSVVDLIEDGVPVAGQREMFLNELIALVQDDKPNLVVQRMRMLLRGEICRSLVDESGRMTTILFEERLEELLGNLVGIEQDRAVVRLNPAESLLLTNAVRRHVTLLLANPGEPPPVLVTLPRLREPMARLLRQFDDPLPVVSFTELEWDLVIPKPGGLVTEPDVIGTAK